VGGLEVGEVELDALLLNATAEHVGGAAPTELLDQPVYEAALRV
jgi:hypothetical protein